MHLKLTLTQNKMVMILFQILRFQDNIIIEIWDIGSPIPLENSYLRNKSYYLVSSQPMDKYSYLSDYIPLLFFEYSRNRKFLLEIKYFEKPTETKVYIDVIWNTEWDKKLIYSSTSTATIGEK